MYQIHTSIIFRTTTRHSVILSLFSIFQLHHCYQYLHWSFGCQQRYTSRETFCWVRF